MLVYNGDVENIKRKYKCDKCDKMCTVYKIHEVKLLKKEWNLCEDCIYEIIDYIKEM